MSWLGGSNILEMEKRLEGSGCRFIGTHWGGFAHDGHFQYDSRGYALRFVGKTFCPPDDCSMDKAVRLIKKHLIGKRSYTFQEQTCDAGGQSLRRTFEIIHPHLEGVGRPHRGRAGNKEKQIVRNHLDQVNGLLAVEGYRQIDPNNPAHAARYGLDPDRSKAVRGQP